MVYADSEGMIWIGYVGGNLDRLDPLTNTFTHYFHDDKDAGTLNGSPVMDILMAHDGTLWVGTSGGLDRLNKGSTRFVHYRNESENKKSLTANFVNVLFEDSKGTLWVGTEGFIWVTPKAVGGGLNRMESDGTFTQFVHDPKDPTSLGSNHVTAIFEDSRGVFWVGTDGDNGLYTLDCKSGKFQRHEYDAVHPSKLSRPPLLADEWHRETDIVTFIREDHNGHIWIGTLWAGLTRYDPVAEKVTRYNNSNGYPDGSSWNGFVSKDGVLWVCNVEYRWTAHQRLGRFEGVRLFFGF